MNPSIPTEYYPSKQFFLDPLGMSDFILGFLPMIAVSYIVSFTSIGLWCRTRHRLNYLEGRVSTVENHQIAPTIVVPPPQQQVPYGYGYQVYPQQPRWYTPPAPSAPQENPSNLV